MGGLLSFCPHCLEKCLLYATFAADLRKVRVFNP